MNRISRFFLSLSLILAAPGLAPYQAAAQTMAARVSRLPTAFGGGTSSPYGSVVALPGISASVLPSASLQTSLIPSLSPSVALTPVLSAPAALNASGAIAKIVPAAALQPLALKAVVPAAAAPEKLAGTPVQAIDALKNGAGALTAAAKNSSADAPRVALDGLFEGSTAKPEALAVSALSAAAETPRLEPSDADGSSRAKTPAGPDSPKPASLIKRTLSVGFIAAVIPIAITMGSIAIAQAFGYQLHSNYHGPMGTQGMTLLQAVAVWVGAAVMAPVSEEAIFRGGLQGRLAKLAAKLHINSFIVPALITSVIFVALHETSDPLLFATRLVHAMILSHVYRKEGILASMAAHGFFNGLLALSLVFTAAGLPLLNIAIAPMALFFAWRAFRALKAQRPDIASGALAPKPLTAGLSFLFAGLLMLGYFFLMPNIFWPLGAVALVVAGIRKTKKA